MWLNHDDCVWITGGGEIESETSRNSRRGTSVLPLEILVTLRSREVSLRLLVPPFRTGNITTDVIFRNNVEVDGDVTPVERRPGCI